MNYDTTEIEKILKSKERIGNIVSYTVLVLFILSVIIFSIM